MDIYIGADHRGFKLKTELADWLKGNNHTVHDLGADEYNKDDDYPDFGVKVARTVAEKPEERLGIVICGSGVGMASAAGKVRGIRAGLIHDPEMAKVARNDDNVNVLALGSDYIDLENAKQVTSAWLSASFSKEERHLRRLKEIEEYERENSCKCSDHACLPPDKGD